MTTDTQQPQTADQMEAIVSRVQAAISNQHSPIWYEGVPTEDIAAIVKCAMAMRAACKDVALTIERSHGDNVGFAEADVLRAAINGEFPPMRGCD